MAEMEYYLLRLILLTDVPLIICISAEASNGKWLMGMNTRAVLTAKVDDVMQFMLNLTLAGSKEDTIIYYIFSCLFSKEFMTGLHM